MIKVPMECHFNEAIQKLFLKEQLRHALWQTFKSLPKLVTDNQTLTIKKMIHIKMI